jgi:serpin B
MKKSFCVLLSLSIAILLRTAPGKGADAKPSAPPAELVAGNNRFAFELYQQLAKHSDSSLFFSPYSVSTALAMVYAGAKGDTAEQMAKTLHFMLPPDQLHAAFGALQRRLTADVPNRGFQFRVANRLWGQQGSTFLSLFLAVTKNDYGAELGLVDFANQSEAARTTINSWVEKRTDNKIKDLVPSGAVGDQTRLVLTNAIYFNAQWQSPFEESSTAKGHFHVSKGQAADVDFMHQRFFFGYRRLDKLQVLDMPYGSTGLSMLFLLPSQVDGLAELEKSLTAETVDGWIGELNASKVIVTLPKFKATQEAELSKILSDLGMPLAFSPTSADFSGMDGGRDLLLSAVLHKAFVDVNEKGTEAAAATGALMSLSAAPSGPPEEFIADHPFVFLIRGAATHTILFMGRYTGSVK